MLPAGDAPVLMWFRRDLRLEDNRALVAACQIGGPVIPVFIKDEVVDGQGAAPRFRLGLSVQSLAEDLERAGSRLILRSGPALEALRDVIRETGARAVVWTRLYDPVSRARDEPVKSALREDGIEARSLPGHLLFEPWETQTKTGGYYKVYTPFWRAVAGRDPGGVLAQPRIPAPDAWPRSETLDHWQLAAQMRRGTDVVRAHCVVGAQAAQDRLDDFTTHKMDRYKTDRDLPDRDGGSGLSENLTYGEISPRALWWAGQRALQEGRAGAETFLKEVVWREFAYHLIHHAPQITTSCWRSDWDDFPWDQNANSPEFHAWTMGRTGEPFVDAGMRQLWVTGVMHNRVRMIVASYLTKHLLIDWRLGMRWFEDQLIDWDPASNAMGWQWVAGCGPDASPYFRIFNPSGQADKFDGAARYRDRFLAPEGDMAAAYYAAIPRSDSARPTDPAPRPLIDLAEGRNRALAIYQSRRSQ